jgi:hypothetical protein
MARDKARDDKFFNCSQDSEHDYVAGCYAEKDRPRVREFLKKGCADGTIKGMTHAELYDLIEAKLGL